MQINMLSIFTGRFVPMRAFYRDVLGMTITVDHEDHYVEFAGQGVRLAICERAVMQRLGLSAGYDNPAQGQAFGLAFECSCAEDVNRRLAELVDAGAERIAVGNRMPWGQYTAFFADPDGHIHELFARLGETT
ncbi:MAG: VOC family protein [Planctomycetales bacterium]|nr:VOC family protein [Planctomycetales bacterium]